MTGPSTVYTIGHSTRPIEEFLAILRAHGIERVADVRTIPRSRHNPTLKPVASRRRARLKPSRKMRSVRPRP